MVEVFKTNVTHEYQANGLLDKIHTSLTNYKANFDLEDCDKILRIKSFTGLVETCSVINILNQSGFEAEVLSDDFPTT